MEGKQIGNFKILQKLGEGGMGVVYKGIDVQLDRPVAIKMLNADLARNPELVQRFQAEARAQANLNHTNIATLYAFLVTEEGACMVMEFVEGESFEQMIRRAGPMNARDAVLLFKQALLGIGAAHRVGIVHRDIKPANLMLNRQGIVKVMDFGIAKALGVRGMTRTGMQMGTVLYMSPEQIQSRTIDVRTDIYALGVTLYEMLSGHVPFESESDFQVMHDHVNSPPPPLTRYYPYAAKEFENVVAKALEKNPDQRYQTVEEFGAALEHPENVPAPSYVAVAPPVVRGTTIETPPAGGPAVAAFGVAPAQAPSSGLTPPPVGLAQGTVTQATGGVIAPEPQPGNNNKVVLGVVIAAALVLAAIAFRPKGPGPAPAGGGSGGGVVTNKPVPIAPRNDTPNIVVATGGGITPTSSTSTPTSTTSADVTGSNRPARPKPTPASVRVQAQTVPAQGQSSQQQAQVQQPQVQEPQPQIQQQPQVQQPNPYQQPQQRQQPQQQAQVRAFAVKHRHVVMRGFQSLTYFCGGWLTIRPDGSVVFICTATNDPSGRCDKVAFPAGSIRESKMRGGGELHITTSGMGNWDFYDLNIAGSTLGAFQAIQALGR